jgi:biopolymer transport protein ExbD
MSISLADSDLDDDGDFGETHEINVTPFIDVMLVLLIIFMVAAPLSNVDGDTAEEAGKADLCQHQA